MAKRITWWKAAEILGTSVSSMRRRWRWRYEQLHLTTGCSNRRRGRPCPKRVPLATVEGVFSSATLKVYVRAVRLEPEQLYLYGAVRLGLNKTFAKPKLGR